MKPVILVTSCHRLIGNPQRLSNVVPVFYIESIVEAGGKPLILPVLDSGSILDSLLDLANGVVLIGGGDYEAGGAHPEARYVEEAREEHDFRLWRALVERDVAVLGICLGMQLMNLGAGGTIWEDIPSQIPNSLCHKNSKHWVELRKQSRLESLLGEKIRVNSSHHQSPKEIGKGLRAVGFAKDGVVEAVEGTGHRFLVGVQWHPERMEKEKSRIQLWGAFIRAAAGDGRWE